MRKCPSCATKLVPEIVYADQDSPVRAGPVEIDVCPACGGIWFDQGEAEVISYQKIAQLLAARHATVDPIITRPCPTCGSILQPLRSQNLPPQINASYCPGCRGAFFSPSNLLKYKQAQMSKIAYFKNFKIPLPASSLLLTGMVGLLLVGVVGSASLLRSRYDNRIRAERLISKPLVTTLAADRVTLTFVTQQAVVAKLQVEAPYISQPRILPVSNTPRKLHQITLKDLRPNTEYNYQIILYDQNNIKTVSEQFTFRTP